MTVNKTVGRDTVRAGAVRERTEKKYPMTKTATKRNIGGEEDQWQLAPDGTLQAGDGSKIPTLGAISRPLGR